MKLKIYGREQIWNKGGGSHEIFDKHEAISENNNNMNHLPYQVLTISCSRAVSSKEVLFTEPVVTNLSGFLVAFLFHESGNAAKSFHVCPSHEIFDTLRTQDSVIPSVRHKKRRRHSVQDVLDKTQEEIWRDQFPGPPRPPEMFIVSRRGANNRY